jgi:hypothetical protein
MMRQSGGLNAGCGQGSWTSAIKWMTLESEVLEQFSKRPSARLVLSFSTVPFDDSGDFALSETSGQEIIYSFGKRQ